MWKNILKRKGRPKRLDYGFLKTVAIALGERYSGKTLTREQFKDEFLESVRAMYSAKHLNITKERIQNEVIKILKRNNMLEVKKKYEIEPRTKFTETRRYYIFK